MHDVTIAKATGNTAKLDPNSFDSATGDVIAPFFPGSVAAIKPIDTLDGSTPGDGGQVVFTVPTDDPLSTAGNPPSSVTLTIVDNDAAPTVPRNLAAEADDGSVTLTWQRPMSYETTQLTGYELKVTPGVGSFTSFADIPGSDAGTTSYEVTGLTNGTAYTFQVQAKNDHGSSTAVSVTETPRVRGVVLSRGTITEGESATLTILPDGAPFGTLKNITLVLASHTGADRPIVTQDFWVSVSGNVRSSYEDPFNAGGFSGLQRHFDIPMLATDSELIVEVNATDDGVSECRESVTAFAYRDYGTSSQTKIGATHTIRIEDDDNRPTLESATVDGRTVTLTFTAPMTYVAARERSLPRRGDIPHTPEMFFTLFESKSSGVPDPSDSNLGNANYYQTVYGTGARTFDLSGRVVTLTFPHAVDATHDAWVRYDRFSRYSPLGTTTSGRCIDRRGVASFIADLDGSDNTGGTTPLPALTIADAEGTEGADADIAFTVTLTPASTELVTVDYKTVARTATEGEDFTRTRGTLRFEPGQTTKTVRVPIIDDNVEDDGETFLLDLYEANGATMVDTESWATGTIHNTEAETEGPETPANTLTASFANVPAEHGGAGESNRFTFDLAFSENLELSYETLRDHAFTVTGGDVKKAQRKVQGSNRTWTITVEPDGWGDVSLTLPGGTGLHPLRRSHLHRRRPAALELAERNRAGPGGALGRRRQRHRGQRRDARLRGEPRSGLDADRDGGLRDRRTARRRRVRTTPRPAARSPSRRATSRPPSRSRSSTTCMTTAGRR